MTNDDRTLLVTGASGHLGRRIVELLLDAHAGRVIAATRHPTRLSDLAERGALVRGADFDVPHTLTEAFEGADRMLLISTDAALGGRRVGQHRAAIEAAARVGVKHVVYTSMTHPEDSPVPVAADHLSTEQALFRSSLDWTVLRNNMYAEVMGSTLSRTIATGRLVAAAGDGGGGYVTREDCARADAAVLASRVSGRTTLEITGPEVVTHTQLAAIAGQAAGKPVTYVPVAPEEARKMLLGAGVPRPYADVLVGFDLAIANGHLGVTSTAVQELTGRTPTSMAEFVPTHLVPA